MTGEHRIPVPARTAEARLLVVVRAPSAEAYAPVLDVLVEHGIRSVELTLTTPGTLDALPSLVERYEGVDVGVGTVLRPDELRRAVDGGAAYLVTPVTDAGLVETAVASGAAIVPGGLTPTELFASWSRGAAAVKVFPASQVSPGYVKDLRGPFPGMQVVPSGGIDLDGAEAWLRAGAAAVSVGGPLLGDAFAGGDPAALGRRTRAFVERCDAVPR